MNLNSPELLNALLDQMGPCPRGGRHAIGAWRQIAALGGYAIGVIPCAACGLPLLPQVMKVKERGFIDRVCVWLATR